MPWVYQSTGFPTWQLTKESFISRELGSGTRLETESFLREMGVDVNGIRIAVEVRSTESIKHVCPRSLPLSSRPTIIYESMR